MCLIVLNAKLVKKIMKGNFAPDVRENRMENRFLTSICSCDVYG